MLSFRQRIFLIYLLVFLIFIAIMSPLSSVLVRWVVENAMENRAQEIIARIQSSSDNEEMVRRLKELKPLTFFRISVITSDHTLLYDSHTKRLLGPGYSSTYIVNYPEVLKAFKKGKGYNEEYSHLLAQKFAYTALAFDFHGKTYVVRTAFPYRYIREFINDFEVGFLFLGSGILIAFSLMTWFIINRLTRPFQEVISAVASYKENEKNPLPELKSLAVRLKEEDVGKLAITLVSLSDRLQNQIRTFREERNEKEVLLESLVEGVVAIDPHFNITFANSSALKFLGLEKKDLIGVHFKDIEQAKAYELLVHCQHEGAPIVDTLRLEVRGEIFYLDIVAVPKKDKTGAILVMLDKSDHYKILEMRKDFIANASHELKTPITIIRGFAETIHEHPDLDKELMHDITGKIVRNCDRMATVIRDLLALADIENIPSSRIQSFNLEEQINHVVQTVKQIYKDAEISVVNQTGQEILLEADYDLIELAFTNLVSNAAKYSNAPAHISITLSSDNKVVKIDVADKGIGIPKEDLHRIFERFYRVDKAHSRKVGGSGLGLSIVQTIVKKHFGHISVHSKVEEGTTFMVQLPLHHTSQ